MDLYRKYCYVLVVLLISLPKCCEADILVGLGIAGIATFGAGAGMHWLSTWEVCIDYWTRPATGDKYMIHDILTNNLFGQHLVMKIVPFAVYNHIFNENPQKPLVMSFHGGTGCGKNFVADLIAKYIYRGGSSSEFVHLKLPGHYPNSSNIENYKNELHEFIKSRTKRCGRSLFIFDEMDKMPSGITDVLKPFLDYHRKVDGVDYKKNVFIFLNNVGGNEINRVTLEYFNAGKAREDITLDILSLSSLALQGGFKGSELILSGLVDYFVPFLPMERTHVKQCASAEIKRQKLTLDREAMKEIVDRTIDELQFSPGGIFSEYGCKKVSKKVEAFPRK